MTYILELSNGVTIEFARAITFGHITFIVKRGDEVIATGDCAGNDLLAVQKAFS